MRATSLRAWLDEASALCQSKSDSSRGGLERDLVGERARDRRGIADVEDALEMLGAERVRQRHVDHRHARRRRPEDLEARSLVVGDAPIANFVDVDAAHEELEASPERAEHGVARRRGLHDPGAVEHRSHDLPPLPHVAAFHELLGGEPLHRTNFGERDVIAERAARVEVAARGDGRVPVVGVSGGRAREELRQRHAVELPSASAFS